jgi:hypothetical protein
MTYWINGDAKDASGQRFKTKAALKRAVAEDPDSVTLLPTAMFTTQPEVKASGVVGDDAWSIAGPNPYTDRRWYATVRRNSKGKVTVS